MHKLVAWLHVDWEIVMPSLATAKGHIFGVPRKTVWAQCPSNDSFKKPSPKTNTFLFNSTFRTLNDHPGLISLSKPGLSKRYPITYNRTYHTYLSTSNLYLHICVYMYLMNLYIYNENICIYHPQHPPTTLPTKDSWTSQVGGSTEQLVVLSRHATPRRNARSRRPCRQCLRWPDGAWEGCGVQPGAS